VAEAVARVTTLLWRSADIVYFRDCGLRISAYVHRIRYMFPNVVISSCSIYF
jgi:hypothetical protein